MVSLHIATVTMAIICTCASFPTLHSSGALWSSLIPEQEKRQTGSSSELAQMMFEYGDINHDSMLTMNEVKNFFKNSLGFPETKALKVAKKIMQMGDLTEDGKLEFVEAAIAIMMVSDRWNTLQ